MSSLWKKVAEATLPGQKKGAGLANVVLAAAANARVMSKNMDDTLREETGDLIKGYITRKCVALRAD